MAQFNWTPQADAGCPFCGTSVNERGFVDCIADTVVRDPQRGEITGVVDITICATCAEQIARMVGSATQFETMEMAQNAIDVAEELEKTKDEVMAWNQRFDNLITALSEGIDVSSIDRAASGALSSPTSDSEPGEGIEVSPEKSRKGKS